MAKAKGKPAGLVEALRQAIADSGMTHYGLWKASGGKESGVGVTMISRFMAGERDLRLESAAKLAAVLNLELIQRK
jgi:hypothetical protein